jgi:hypothetical protein
VVRSTKKNKNNKNTKLKKKKNQWFWSTHPHGKKNNKCLENYLRCFTQDNPKHWAAWLPWAEYWFNTRWHSSTHMTPFEEVYGVPPPRLLNYIPGTT